MSQLGWIIPALFFVAHIEGLRYGSNAKTLHFPSTNDVDYLGKGPFKGFQKVLVDPGVWDSDLTAESRGRIVSQIHGRSRRDAGGGAHHTSPNLTTSAALNDSHYQMIIHWAGEGSSVIMALTKDPHPRRNATSFVYLSNNYGESFTEIQASKMQLPYNQIALIDKFYNSPAIKSHYIFTDVEHNYTFVTENYCRTMRAYHTPFSPRNIAFHGTTARTLIGHDDQDPQKRLWLSTNLGASWRVIQRGVKSFFWGKHQLDSVNTLFIQRESTGGLSNVIQSDNFFARRPFTLISGVIDFEVRDNYMFATKNDTSLSLHVSYNREAFQPAIFPESNPHMDYFIADASEDQVFAVVSHVNRSNHLYISEVKGIHFTLSLSNIVYFNPNLPSSGSSWLRLSMKVAFADLHKVNGLRGIYIASQYNTSTLSAFNQSSVITFNKGASWRPLVAPTEDSLHKSTNCSAFVIWPHYYQRRCSLHLTQIFHAMYQMTRTVPILSKKNAIGLVMGTGNTGLSIERNLNVYLSTDAGMSWSEVLKGSYFYAFGDHGGIIVAVARGALTGEILYSHDEGETWESYEFSAQKVFVYGLLTEPGEKTTTFSVFGSYPTHHSWLVIQVNLSSVLGNICTREDYKQWSPTDDPRVSCLLGRRTVYERRRAHSLCFNSRDYEHIVSSENCSCSNMDFECDVGFTLPSYWAHQCVYNASSGVDLHAIPQPCPEGGFYYRSKGYRRVEGNTCEGGEAYRYDPEQISCPVTGNEEFILFTTRKHIYRFMFDEQRKEEIYTPLIQNALAIDYDYKSNCVFWADSGSRTIEKMCLDGHNSSEILVTENLEYIEGLAYDWMSHQIYWVDVGNNKIEVARDDGSHRRVLITNGTLDKPRAIIVCPKYGLMFWSDWSDTNPRIMQAWLDGSHITTVVRGVTNLRWPNGLAIDYQHDQLYWTDANLHSISYIKLFESDAAIHVLIQDLVRLPHLYAIDVYKDDVYVTDWQRGAILSVDKRQIEGRSVPIRVVLDLDVDDLQLLDLKILHRAVQQGIGPCSHGRGGCTSLCMNRPGNASQVGGLNRTCLCSDVFPVHILRADGSEQCLCSDNQAPSMNSTCLATGNSSCGLTELKCHNNKCIPLTWKCDGDNDCGDMSDERDCSYHTCSSSQFQCDNQHCIPNRWVCDQDNDCGDNSDEVNCNSTVRTCMPGQFTCANGLCISQSWVCDGDNDCSDWSDENNCTVTMTQPPQTCSSQEFTCLRGHVSCVQSSWKCDGDRDCEYGSDEANCNSTLPQCDQHRQFTCNNGQCIPIAWRCNGPYNCPHGEDEANCSYTTESSTTTGRPDGNCTGSRSVRCGWGGCIYPDEVCDGTRDCLDGSDEWHCGGYTTPIINCRQNFRSCDSGQCIRSSLWCNGERNCYDGSDERNCATHIPCYSYQFRCVTGQCIPMSWVCDQEADCMGGEDEINCNGTRSCGSHEFMCTNSADCVSLNWLCDGTEDCADGSDEFSCGNMTTAAVPTRPSHNCGQWEFSCEQGVCIPLYMRCNGIYDCLNNADEASDSCSRGYSITSLSSKVENASVIISWDPNGTDGSMVNVYLCANSNLCFVRNTSQSSSVTFAESTPGESYISGSYLYWARVVHNGRLNPPTSRHRLYLHTVPSPPTDVVATNTAYKLTDFSQPEKVIQVTWKAPTVAPEYYLVYWKDNNIDKVQFNIARELSYIILGYQLTAGNSYEIWVTSWTTRESVRSNVVRLTYGCNETQCFSATGLSFSDIKADSVVLAWTPASGAQEYNIVFTCPLTLEKWRKVEKTMHSVTVRDLSPGVTYDVSVYVEKPFCSRQSCKAVFTTGGTAHIPQLKKAQLKSSTSVSLMWTDANYTPSTPYKYQVYYSDSPRTVENLASVNDTFVVEKAQVSNKTQLDIENLAACREYCFRVQLIEPHRSPLSKPAYVETLEDRKAQPTGVAATDQNITDQNANVVITWRKPCEHDTMGLAYLINMTNEAHLSQVFEVPATDNLEVQHLVKGFHRGARYLIQVRVNLHRDMSRFSTPIKHVVAPYPPPVALEVTDISDCAGCLWITWKKPKSLKQPVTYVLQYAIDFDPLKQSENDANFSMVAETNDTRYFVKDSHPNTVVYFRVCMRIFNYLSNCTSALEVFEHRYEKSSGTVEPQTSNSKKLLMGTLIPAVIIVLVISIALGVYIIRHRRLQNSFASFANSHYDRQAGTTTFGAGDDLDGDDVPIIRGFAEDEPMVVA